MGCNLALIERQQLAIFHQQLPAADSVRDVAAIHAEDELPGIVAVGQGGVGYVIEQDDVGERAGSQGRHRFREEQAGNRGVVGEGHLH